MDSNVCFSPAALTLLASVAVVVQAMTVALFWALQRAKDDSIRDARAERDRAADNLERALNIGETTAGLRAPRRRP